MSKPSTPLADRFWPKVSVGRPDECWEWTAYRTQRGYGQLASGGHGSKLVYAHRLAWEIAYGPIPDGLHVCHTCDNPACVNPQHLWLGTQGDNMLDRDAKGRVGHKITDEQVREIRSNVDGRNDAYFAAKFDVHKVTISKIRLGRTRQRLVN